MPRPLRPPGETRRAVAELLYQGLSQAAIGRALGLSRGTVAHHVRALGVAADGRFARRHDWAEIRAYYEEGHSVRECIQRFGFSSKTWMQAVARGAVVPRPQGMPVEELLVGPRARTHVKTRLIRAGLLEPRCAECGIDSWRGEPLSLCLHHVNGDPADNRLENLQLVCPNCHSQTENFAGRNRRAARG